MIGNHSPNSETKVSPYPFVHNVFFLILPLALTRSVQAAWRDKYRDIQPPSWFPLGSCVISTSSFYHIDISNLWDSRSLSPAVMVTTSELLHSYARACGARRIQCHLPTTNQCLIDPVESTARSGIVISDRSSTLSDKF